MHQRIMVACATASLVALAGCARADSNKGADASPEASARGSAALDGGPPGLAQIPAPPDVAAPPDDAEKTASGLAFKVLQPGTGTVHPSSSDKVKVDYTGWTKDGRMFDSSISRGRPGVLALGSVIPGWGEALQLMVVGEKRRLWIPAALAYGVRPRPGPPAGDLVFDVELLDVIVGPKPPPVPEDVGAPPATAKKTASGLSYRVLTPGAGTAHPAATSSVTVNYSGWTTDGKMFDSSVTRGQPATFQLDHVIKGWTEGVALMKKGEKTRFWIPGSLAYGDTPKRPGAPSGTLVFDIELVDFK